MDREIYERIHRDFGEVGLSAPKVAHRALEKIGKRRNEVEILAERTRDVMTMASQIAHAGTWRERGFFGHHPHNYRGTEFIPIDEELSVALREDSHASHNRHGIVTCLFIKRREEIGKIGEFISGGEIDLTGVGTPSHSELDGLEELFIWMVQNR